MKTNNRKPVLAANQNTGMKIETTAGTSSTAARPKNTTANTGSVKRSRRRAGFRPWYRQIAPASAKIADATKLDPNSTGNRGCQPPRNRMVVIEATVTMLAYSAKKNAANFMLLYSVWKPATSSVSASGRSNGMRLVSANAAIRKMKK